MTAAQGRHAYPGAMPARRLARRLAPLLLVAALIACVPSPAGAADRASLRSVLNAGANDLGPNSGVLVKDVTTDTELFSARPDSQLIPASNEKLFTTTAALLGYGASATLSTALRVRSSSVFDPLTGTQTGDLYLVGGGDPTLRAAGLRRLVSQLRARGIVRIEGGVRADESWQDTRRGSFDSRWKIDSDLAGQLSALAFEHGKPGSAKRAAEALDEMLRSAGIAVGSEPRRARLGEPGIELAAVASPPVATLARMINVPSENFYSEMLVKDMGASFGGAGSTQAGIGFMRQTLADTIGIKPRMVDGSGLSRSNRTTARQIVNLLDEVDERPEVAVPFAESLPRMGHDGTVRHRLRGTSAASRCAAKTGTLIGVSALSGYCRAAGGNTIAFSIIANRVNSGVAKQIEDRLVSAIARYAT